MRPGQFLRYSLGCRLIIKESRKLILHRFAHAQYWVLWSDFERIGNQRKGIMGIVIHMRRVRGDGEGGLCRHDTLQLADLISGGGRLPGPVSTFTPSPKRTPPRRKLLPIS